MGLNTRSMLRVGIVTFLVQLQLATAQTDANAALVSKHVPKQLVELNARFGTPDALQQEFVTADFERAGQVRTIVAAYSDGDDATIRVIDISSNTEKEVPGVTWLGGGSPTLELVDIDTDGIPEVFVSLWGVNGSAATWLLRWDSSTRNLRLWGPTIKEGADVFTLLKNHEVADFDGDGKLEVISGPDPNGEMAMYKALGGSLQKVKSGLLFQRLTINSSESSDGGVFYRSEPNIRPLLQLSVIGANNQQGASGIVTINDEVVVPDNALKNAGGKPVYKRVSIKDENEWDMSVKGPLLATVVLVIEMPSCDLNKDGKIDLNDIALISNARGLTAAPEDFRDYDGDGIISANDARACTLKCTNARCAP